MMDNRSGTQARQSLFQQLKRHARQMESGIEELKLAINSKTAFNPESAAEGMNCILHMTKEMKDLRRKASSMGEEFKSKSQDTSTINSAARNILKFYSQRLEKAESFMEKYGYIRPEVLQVNADESLRHKEEDNHSDSDQACTPSKDNGGRLRALEQNPLLTPKLEDFCPRLAEQYNRLNKETDEVMSETKTVIPLVPACAEITPVKKLEERNVEMDNRPDFMKTPEMPENLKHAIAKKEATMVFADNDSLQHQECTEDFQEPRKGSVTKIMFSNSFATTKTLTFTDEFSDVVQNQQKFSLTEHNTGRDKPMNKTYHPATPEVPQCLQQTYSARKENLQTTEYTHEMTSHDTLSFLPPTPEPPASLKQRIDWSGRKKRQQYTEYTLQLNTEKDKIASSQTFAYNCQPQTPEPPPSVRDNILNMKTEHDDNNISNPLKGMQSISHDYRPRTPEPPEFIKQMMNSDRDANNIASNDSDHQPEPSVQSRLWSGPTLPVTPEAVKQQMLKDPLLVTPETPQFIRAQRKASQDAKKLESDQTQSNFGNNKLYLSETQPLSQSNASKKSISSLPASGHHRPNNPSKSVSMGPSTVSNPQYTADDLDRLTADNPHNISRIPRASTTRHPTSAKSLFDQTGSEGIGDSWLAGKENWDFDLDNMAALDEKSRYFSSKSSHPF